MTSDQRDEAVLRARAAARDGQSIHINPYHPEGQREQWQVWRLAYADAAADPDADA